MRCFRRVRRTSMVLSLPVAALLTVALPSLLHAQTCLGAPSYHVAPLQLGVGASFTDGSKGAGVQFGLGARQGLFMNAGLDLVSYDALDGNGVGVSGSLGYDVAVTPTPATGPAPSASVSFCPLATISYNKLPSFSDGFSNYDAHELDAGGGVALGVSVAVAPTISIIPFGTFAYYYGRATVSASGFGSQSASDSFGSAGLGLGLLLNQRITVRPSVAFPLGIDGATPTFNFGVGFQVGSRQ
jgi:hypothetical protein